ncbi:hypothetical protein QTL95_09330 [Rhizobium sp. S152]|uniref:Restriction endonuclease n=1 Tax=Halobaculum lipolyticum TaxID=3032001 RepID=A0ABD5WC19_9EURY|nr:MULTISPECIES: hypothetical protein [Bacteria]MDM9626098.1 hypothetical protein [Rhizobium sp. S152]
MSEQSKLDTGGEIEIPTEQNNIYWFLRFLGASDLGSFAKKEPDATQRLGKELGDALDDDMSLKEARGIIDEVILGTVNEFHHGSRTKRYSSTEDLVEAIDYRIESLQDLRDLQLACEFIVKTTHQLGAAPEFDDDAMEVIVIDTLFNEDRTQYQPENAYDALKDVDEEGTVLQAGGQNRALVPYVQELIEKSDVDGQNERARLIAAVTQEYERRAGNKRKSDAGGVLETALNLVFDAFGVPVTGEPRHHGDFEIDNMLITDGATIGFSCKRTLRERFRQSLTREAEIDIDEVWFVPLEDDDISEEKILDIQKDGSRVYISRDTYTWEEYGDDPELHALRPGDQFLNDLAQFTGIELQTEVN